jgi:hypothetical protein
MPIIKKAAALDIMGCLFAGEEWTSLQDLKNSLSDYTHHELHFAVQYFLKIGAIESEQTDKKKSFYKLAPSAGEVYESLLELPEEFDSDVGRGFDRFERERNQEQLAELSEEARALIKDVALQVKDYRLKRGRYEYQNLPPAEKIKNSKTKSPDHEIVQYFRRNGRNDVLEARWTALAFWLSFEKEEVIHGM